MSDGESIFRLVAVFTEGRLLPAGPYAVMWVAD